MKKPPSLVKWTGSKRSQSLEISKLFPKAERYIEPFLGGGSLLYMASEHYDTCIGSDIYDPLMRIWKKVKNSPKDIIDSYASEWNKLQDNFPDHYYIVRDRFNEEQDESDLLFLSRTCVNGIIRFNKQGKFNNSLHVSRRGMKPELFKKIVYQWSERLSNVELYNLHYYDLLEYMKKGDFLYIDPPYFNSTNRYISDLDYNKFIEFLDELNKRKIKWMLSFDGTRGDNDLTVEIPETLYKQHLYIKSGNSAVKKVLSSSVEEVHESLYLNY